MTHNDDDQTNNKVSQKQTKQTKAAKVRTSRNSKFNLGIKFNSCSTGTA